MPPYVFKLSKKTDMIKLGQKFNSLPAELQEAIIGYAVQQQNQEFRLQHLEWELNSLTYTFSKTPHLHQIAQQEALRRNVWVLEASQISVVTNGPYGRPIRPSYVFGSTAQIVANCSNVRHLVVLFAIDIRGCNWDLPDPVKLSAHDRRILDSLPTIFPHLLGLEVRIWNTRHRSPGARYITNGRSSPATPSPRNMATERGMHMFAFMRAISALKLRIWRKGAVPKKHVTFRNVSQVSAVVAKQTVWTKDVEGTLTASSDPTAALEKMWEWCEWPFVVVSVI